MTRELIAPVEILCFLCLFSHTLRRNETAMPLFECKLLIGNSLNETVEIHIVNLMEKEFFFFS